MPSTVRDSAASITSRRQPRLTTSSMPPLARRKTLQLLLVFVTLVLVINALIGDRGLMETLRARQKHSELVQSIERLRAENVRLREDARRLRSDPGTIEALARQELGLIKPGEVLFIIKDARPAAAADTRPQ
jgi:cell division protein FtsB